MTREQFNRWRDFALRMVEILTVTKRPSREWVRERVEDFIDGFSDEDVEKIEDWDSSPVYVCDRSTNACYDDPDHPGFWSIQELKEGQLPPITRDGDFGKESARRWARREKHDQDVERWEEKYDDPDREMMAHDQFDEQWWSPVSCCVRAGLDMACEPSAGVIGFTMGDLRKMYPEGIPDWIFADEISVGGLLEEGRPITRAEFLAMPDEMGVIL